MRYVFLLIILLVSCKPTAIINRNAIREKTSTLKGAIDYQDFTVSIQIGRAHVWTPVTATSRMPSSAWKKKKKQ